MRWKTTVELFWDASRTQDYILKARSRKRAGELALVQAQKEHKTDMLKVLKCVEYHTCSSCGNEGKPLHMCCYDSDIHNDHSDKCTCCNECEHNCAMEI